MEFTVASKVELANWIAGGVPETSIFVLTSPVLLISVADWATASRPVSYIYTSTRNHLRQSSPEDFAPANGWRILDKYRDRICTFNDDMQGTGAITLAAAISAVRVCGTPLRNQRVVIFGAGTAGIGVADQMRDAIVREGLAREDGARHFWCVDRQGLITTDMADQLRNYQVT